MVVMMIAHITMGVKNLEDNLTEEQVMVEVMALIDQFPVALPGAEVDHLVVAVMTVVL